MLGEPQARRKSLGQAKERYPRKYELQGIMYTYPLYTKEPNFLFDISSSMVGQEDQGNTYKFQYDVRQKSFIVSC